MLIGMTMIAASVMASTHATEFGRPIAANLTLNAPTLTGAPQVKKVYLMNVKLTPAQKQKILAHTDTVENNLSDNEESSKRFDQGMNGVPVLDQGRHGSCVTFATTAAVDALIGKGDYISQLCNLELGSYLESRSYNPSGWDGSIGSYVYNQMLQFGIINKDAQKNQTCAGVNEYPADDEENRGTPMSLDDYKQMSESLTENMYWEPLLTFQQRMHWTAATQDKNAQTMLDTVKKTLATKVDGQYERVTFATFIPVAYCSVGACGKYHAANDTWAYTNAMKHDSNPEMGGHEMVITGFDDKAIAVDNEGKKHKGLLTLRNSWGTEAGDKGNYYMSYDFFKIFVMEVQKIGLESDKA